MLLPLVSRAQDEDETTTFPLKNFYAKLRKNPKSLLKNVKFGFSTGYGNTFFSHKLGGFGIDQPKSGPPSIFMAGSATNVHYSNWVNQATQLTGTPVPGNFLVSSDTAKLGFKGNALNIPFKATVHY